MHVRKRAQGDEQSRLVPFDIKQITKQLIPATDGIPNISVKELEDNISLSVSNGITTAEIQSIAIKIALSLTDLDKPGATYVAARLSLYDLYHKIKHLYLKTKVEGDVYKLVTFNDYIKYGVDNNLLSEFPSKYTEEELTELNNTIVGDRDLLFDFQGVKTFLSRYGLTNKKDEIIELPQYLHMGVATFLAQNEKDPVRWSKEFYNITSKLEFINATPINSNGRRRNGSTISCLVVDTPDTASGILDKIKEVGLGSKKGAGFGWNWSSVRSVGSSIGTKPNAAGGKIPFLKIANDLSTAIDQDGTRPGAFAVYINIYDIDILDFIDMKKKNGDERRRCRDLFPSINYDDVFMNRLDNNETYTLFSPHDVPLLKDTYGDEFREHYLNYEKEFLANPDKFNPNTEVISANKVFSQIALSFHGEGVPFTHFIDNSNRQHKYPELGKIRSSNLCSEIFQPTSVDRTAVCNLGSINLARVNSDEDLERVVPIAIRMLDNGIDTTFYPSEQSKLAQLERRSLGLGALGEAELMAQRGIVYGSQEHKDLIGHIYAKIEEISERTTRELAIEKGSCIIDGVRNAYIRAVAPNSTSGIFAGTTNSHECVFDIMWMEDNQTGNYPMTAPNLNINNYKYWTNSYDVDQLTLIDLTKIRQKHTDQGISHTVFLYPEELRASRIKEIFVHAWKQGLLSLYYWRSKPPKNTDTSLATKKDNISCFGCTN